MTEERAKKPERPDDLEMFQLTAGLDFGKAARAEMAAKQRRTRMILAVGVVIFVAMFWPMIT